MTSETAEYLTKKRYVHKSEMPELLKGHIDGHECKIYEATGLPYGMKEGTNEDNFIENRGGWNCGHELIPVSEITIPKKIRDRFESLEYKQFDSRGSVSIEKNYDKKDFSENKKIAELLAEKQGDKVRIREHIYEDGVKNPELEINGRLADLKTPDVKKYKNVSGPIKNLTVKAQEQKAKHTVIRLSERYDKESVINGVKNAFFYADKMEVIDIVFKNKKIARITREKYL